MRGVDYFGEIGDIHTKAIELGLSDDDLLHIVLLGVINEEIRLGSKHYDDDGNLLENAVSVLRVMMEENGTVVAQLKEGRNPSLEYFNEILDDIDYD